MAWKFLKSLEKIDWNLQKKQDHCDLMNDFDCADKSKQPACKTLRVWTKNEDNFENFQENFEIS